MLMPPEFTDGDRYHLQYSDLMDLDIGRPSIDEASLSSKHAELPQGTFDIVIVEARYDHRLDKERHTENVDLLLITQLIIALRKTAGGGCIFIRCKTPERPETVRLFKDFASVANKIRFLKSRKGWGASGYCYMLVSQMTGMERRQPLLDVYMQGLEDIVTGKTSGITPILLDDEVDLVESGTVDTIVRTAGVEAVWEIHTECLQKRLTEAEKKDTLSSPGGTGFGASCQKPAS